MMIMITMIMTTTVMTMMVMMMVVVVVMMMMMMMTTTTVMMMMTMLLLLMTMMMICCLRQDKVEHEGAPDLQEGRGSVPRHHQGPMTSTSTSVPTNLSSDLSRGSVAATPVLRRQTLGFSYG